MDIIQKGTCNNRNRSCRVMIKVKSVSSDKYKASISHIIDFIDSLIHFFSKNEFQKSPFTLYQISNLLSLWQIFWYLLYENICNTNYETIFWNQQILLKLTTAIKNICQGQCCNYWHHLYYYNYNMCKAPFI